MVRKTEDVWDSEKMRVDLEMLEPFSTDDHLERSNYLCIEEPSSYCVRSKADRIEVREEVCELSDLKWSDSIWLFRFCLRHSEDRTSWRRRTWQFSSILPNLEVKHLYFPCCPPLRISQSVPILFQRQNDAVRLLLDSNM